MSTIVGVIGLGQMGTPMSAHLLEAGFEVLGYDIDPERVRRLENTGGRGCGSPAEVAEHADTVVTCLPSPEALFAVLSPETGVLAHARSELVVVETSTFDLDTKARAHEQAEKAGVTLLDCPLSGTSAQAQQKDLVVFASGEEAAVARCRPVFAGFARAHHELGVFGLGSKMKYLANLLVGIHNVAAAEALVLGMKAGLDPQQAYEVLSGSAATSRMLEVRGPMMVAGDYGEPGVSGRIFRKDLEIIGDFAWSVDCPVPLFAASTQLYAASAALGLAEHDTASVCAALERLAGIDERPPFGSAGGQSDR